MRRFLLPALLLSAVLPAAAQFDPERLQVGLHLQTASYDGERSDYKGAGGLGNGFGLEAAYSLPGFLTHFDAVVRFDVASYPGIIAGRPGYPSVNKPESSESRTRFMAYARRSFATPWALQPYASLGLATAAGRINDEALSAWGPVFGLGAQLPVASGRLAIFAEFLSHLTVPSDGVDLADGDSPDRLRAFSAGVRYRIGAPAARTRLDVLAPRRAQIDESASFEATVISDRADAYTVRWVFGDGVEQVGSRATHTFREPGSYTVLVSASDGSETVTRRVSVTVPALPAPLSVRITAPESAYTGESLSFSARPEGGPKGIDRTVTWSLGDGNEAQGERVRHAFSTPGTYTVTVRATTDTESASASATVTVSAPPPVTLSAEFPSGGEPGDALRFSASPEGGAPGARYTVRWSFGDGTEATGNRVRHTFDEPGSYTVEVIASDGNSSASRSATLEIVAPPPPPPPPAREEPARPPVQEPVRTEPPPAQAPRSTLRSIDASAPSSATVEDRLSFSVTARVDGQAASPTVRWVFGDGSTAEGRSVTHAYSSPGRFEWSVVVSLGEQQLTEDGVVDVKARPQPPAARVEPPVVTPPVTPPQGAAQLDVLEVAQAPIRPKAGEEIVFTPVVRGTAYACSWEFGDGGMADVCEARHTYAEAGRYTFRLRVSSGGSTASFTKEVNVETNRCTAIDRLHSVNFFVNSSELIPDMRNLLRENVDLLIGCPGQEIAIAGAATPDEQDAERLANQRALAVYQYYRLMGIPSNRFAAEFEVKVGRDANLETWQQRYARTTLR